MCGIAGGFGAVDEDLRRAVRRMCDALLHRGPDAEGAYDDVDPDGSRGVLLAHRRLKILDLSESANQPMISEHGLAVVYNGEIYNYRELRAELQSDGHLFHTDCDTEVVLRAFEQWGEAAAARLRGMFAIAVWDPRERALTLVRDRFGMKPLYVYIHRQGDRGHRLLFASEVRALLASGLVPRRISRLGLASYCWNGFVCGPETIIADVRSLPAASVTTLRLDDFSERTARFWAPPSPRPGTVGPEELHAVLEDSVAKHLQSDVPLGVFLSGGIDSSAVAAMAARVAELRTFHISFDEASYDESSFAAEVARRIGSDHAEIRLTQDRFRANLDAAMASIDQPTFDGINTYFVSRAVRDAGMTVALAGTGGDELFGGYSSFRDIPRTLRFSRLASIAPRPVALAMAELALKWLNRSRAAVPPQTRGGKLVDLVAARGRLPELYQVQYALFTRAFQRELIAAVAPDASFGMTLPRLEELRQLAAGRPILDAVSVLEITMFLGERLLRDTDAASMASSLEVRVPLIDHVVLDAVSGLATDRRFTPKVKETLRLAAMPQLDRDLFDRPKAGFLLPIEAWCRSRLGNEVEASLFDAEACRSVGLRPDAVARLWAAFKDSASGIYWSRVWSLFVLLDWARRHDATVTV